MKIGFFTDSYFPQINGVTYTLYLWKCELEELGHEVFIYYPKDKSYKARRNEVPLRSMPFPFYKGYRIGLPSFRRVEKDLDIIHIHGLATVADFGLALAKKEKIPCVLTYHTPPDHYMHELLPLSSKTVQETLKRAYYKYEKEFLERCSLITAPSKDLAKELKERWGEEIPKTLALSNGIDCSFFEEKDPGKFKKDFLIPKGRVIGYAGRHSTEKHVEYLLEFAKEFEGTVVILGHGPLTGRYKSLAKGLKNVRFLGFIERERLPEFYSSLDLLILPSTAETEGLVVLEANACGTPAVGADAMGLKDTISDGVNGYKFEPRDLRSLGEAIERAYENLEDLKKGSKRRAKERSVENSVAKLVKIYEKLLK